MHIFSCALCGENRKGDDFTRTHRFLTSESENAQRYPLCSYCLNRVRATCDYLGFLRMIRDGHWRTDGAEAEKLAWEESVRIRERMFWARIGGGVVPAFISRESPRALVEDTKPRTPFSAPPMMDRALSALQASSVKENEDPFLSRAKRATNWRKGITRRDMDPDREDDRGTAERDVVNELSPPPKIGIDPSSKQLHTSLRESLRPRPRSRAASYERERAKPLNSANFNHSAIALPKDSSTQVASDQGLSITIPGSFE